MNALDDNPVDIPAAVVDKPPLDKKSDAPHPAKLNPPALPKLDKACINVPTQLTPNTPSFIA